MSDKHIDNETKEMLTSFVSEAVDSLDNAEPLVEGLQSTDDPEVVNSIFRVFHTLKGLSGFFGMKIINALTHEAETLLDIIRKEKIKVTDDIVTLIYSTFDLLRDLLHLVSNEFSDEAGADDAENMKIILKDAIDKIRTGNFTMPKQEEDFSAFVAPPQSPVQEEFEQQMPGTAETESTLDLVFPEKIESEPEETEQETVVPATPVFDMSGLISEEMVAQYIADSIDLLETTENNLLQLEKEPDNFDLIAAIFGAIHSIKGNSGFMGFSEIEEIAMETETILDSLRKKELDADPTVVSILLSNVETIRKRVEAIASGSTTQPQKTEQELTETIEAPIETKAETKSTPPQKPAQPPQETKQVKEVKPTVSVEKSEQVEPPSELKKDVAKPDPNIAKNFQQAQKQDIRVETVKIDKLFDLVGELITIETMVTNNPDLAGLQLPNFAKAANQLNKITRELQEVTMSVRMMPLEGLFNKMKRLVRDVSLKLGKKVNLTISGQETEMDKNVIDEISDPLVHILRNSMDHGIEFPDERIAKGKSDTGNIHLSARYEGNEILISVKDDGAGIDKERVLKKAEEKGLLTVPPEKMTDKEIFALIFEPGFSTAKQVTDISGRGVGMDVVRKNIEKLRGAIDIESKTNEGTTITLRIPLTLAIMEALLVKVGVDTFAIPLMNVSETFRVDPKDISKTMDGLEMIKVREEILPAFRIHELFKITPKYYELEKGIILIIESRHKKFCLFADELIGQQQAVIKGLSDYIGKVPGITGCMILGDGGIGLILDIEGTLMLAENPSHFNNPNLVYV